jgi:hypothetical protein
MDETMDQVDEIAAPAVETRTPAPSAPVPVAIPALPRAIVLTREMEALEQEIDRMREKPGTTGEQMSPYWARHKQLKDMIDGATAAGEEGPKLSTDPREAAAGILEAEPPNPEALVQRLEVAGEVLTEDGKSFARTIATVFPTEMLVAGEQLMRDVAGMEATAAHEQWNEERAILELSPGDVALWRIGWDRLSAQQRAYLQAQHLHFYPPAVKRIARAMEKWLQTDTGTRWLSTGGGWKVRQDLERAAAEDRRAAQGADD